MSIAFLDEQIKRDSTHARVAGVRAGQASRRRTSVRVAGHRPAGHSRLVSVAPVTGVCAPPTADAPVAVLPRSAPAAWGTDRNRGALTRPARLRLTPRGRWVFGALLVLIALIVFSLGRFSAGANASGPPQHVTVQSGDTLWSIAEQAAPGADPRVEVEHIIAANHLAGASLTPGAVLLVPRG